MNRKPVAPRKKPVQARSIEMVRVILEAAARVLETRGFEGYTTNAVAEKAGVSVGSIYQYFGGKDELTAALIERESLVLLEDVGAIRDVPDGVAAMRRLIAACAAHQMRRPVLARMLDFEERRLPLDEHHARVFATVNGVLEPLLRRLGVAADQAATAAADVLAIVKGMVDGAGERGETSSAALEERVRRAVFGYLRVDSEGGRAL